MPPPISPIYKKSQIIYKWRMKKTSSSPKFNPKNLKSGKLGRKANPHEDDSVIYGLHAVIAALQNPARNCQKLIATKNALNEIRQQTDIPTNLDVGSKRSF